MIKLLVQPRQSTESNNQETFSFFQEFSIFDEIESNFEILANIGGIDLIRELIEILKTETLLRPTQFFTLDFENHFDISIRSHYNEKKPKNFLLKLISQLLLNTSEDITDIATELWKTKTYPNRANANIKTLGLWILNKK